MTERAGFRLPEPPPGIGSDALGDVWEGVESLPRASRMEQVLYFLQRAIENLLALPMSSLITVMTISVSIFLFSGFLLILQNVDRVISGAGSNLNLTAYLKSDAPETAKNELVRLLEADKSIRAVTYVSKEKALEMFKRELGANASILDGLAGENPLPDAVDLLVQPDELGINNVEKVVDKLRQNPVVEEVAYGSEWVKRMQGMIRVFRLFGAITLGIVLCIIIFLISNTIKLVMYSRRAEISVMQLVGATDAFVKVPFVLGGLFQGVLGSIFGLVLLKFCFFLITLQLTSSVAVSVSLPALSFLGGIAILSIIFVGLVVGAVGSLFAMGRFMEA